MPRAVMDVLREPLAPDASESVVQARMECVAKLLAESIYHPQLVLVGRSTTPTIGSRKPNLVVFLADAPAPGRRRAPRPVSCGVLHVVCLADLKSPRPLASAGRFTDAESGGVLGFLEDLVREQPWRTAGGGHARGLAFLSDGVLIVFFECTFSCQPSPKGPVVQLVRARECGPLPLDGAGAQLLTGLLWSRQRRRSGTPQPQCRAPPGGAVVELAAYLGAGATSMGFAATWHGDAVVVKGYHAAADAAVVERSELEALAAAQGVPGVCQLLCRIDGGLLLAPVGAVAFSLRAQATAAQPAPPAGLWSPTHGSPAASVCRAALASAAVLPGAAEFCDLVDAMAGLHAVGWCHRDPRPDNFFRDAAGRFVLCDLGSAARAGAAVAAGDARPWAFPFGPLATLRALARGQPPPPPAPAHDFEQVARLAYAALARDGDSLPTRGTFAELCAWWDARAASPVLTLLLPAAAAAVNGAEELAQLKAALCRVLPRAAAPTLAAALPGES